MSSATEAELAGLYIIAREAVYIRIILEELGHVQPPTPLQTDNVMADGVINIKYNPNEPKPWTWDSTGYAIKNAMTILHLLGTQKVDLHWLLDKTTLRNTWF